jgi:hypothetical protein
VFGVALIQNLKLQGTTLSGWGIGPGIPVMWKFWNMLIKNRILVTLDKDFGELAIVHDAPHSGILRIVNFPAQEQGIVCVNVLNKYGKVLQGSAIVTVEQGRVRIRE